MRATRTNVVTIPIRHFKNIRGLGPINIGRQSQKPELILEAMDQVTAVLRIARKFRLVRRTNLKLLQRFDHGHFTLY
jgi:hypothetical protein